MYYFKSRTEAGDLLANQLEAKYRYENCAVLALGDGAVMVGAQIAIRLHCVINLLLTGWGLSMLIIAVVIRHGASAGGCTCCRVAAG